MHDRQLLQLEHVPQFGIVFEHTAHEVGVFRQYALLMHELHREVFVAHPKQLLMATAQHMFPTLTYGAIHVVHSVVELQILQNGISYEHS